MMSIRNTWYYFTSPVIVVDTVADWLNTDMIQTFKYYIQAVDMRYLNKLFFWN